MKNRDVNDFSPSKLPPGIKMESDIVGVIGILNICGCNYLGVITDANLIGNLYNARIF